MQLLLALPFLALLTITAPAAQAQTTPAAPAVANGTATAQFKTSAVCDMCKARIEKSMAYEKGVQSAVLDVPSKVLTVTYKTDKTTPAALLAARRRACLHEAACLRAWLASEPPPEGIH